MSRWKMKFNSMKSKVMVVSKREAGDMFEQSEWAGGCRYMKMP